MTKIEIIAIRGIIHGFELERMTPKPDWMSEDRYSGKLEAYRSAVDTLGDLLEAAKSEHDEG